MTAVPMLLGCVEDWEVWKPRSFFILLSQDHEKIISISQDYIMWSKSSVWFMITDLACKDHCRQHHWSAIICKASAGLVFSLNDECWSECSNRKTQYNFCLLDLDWSTVWCINRYFVMWHFQWAYLQLSRAIYMLAVAAVQISDKNY